MADPRAAQIKRLEAALRRPENKECFDCTALHPRWASTNLGIFICMRCAGIHRSLGVHITKVKSINMDNWDEDMIVTCENIGNGIGKELYEATAPASFQKPKGTDPNTAVEVLLRNKYERKIYYPREGISPLATATPVARPDPQSRPPPASREAILPQQPPVVFQGIVQNSNSSPIITTTQKPQPTSSQTSLFNGGNVGSGGGVDWGDFKSSPATASNNGPSFLAGNSGSNTSLFDNPPQTQTAMNTSVPKQSPLQPARPAQSLIDDLFGSTPTQTSPATSSPFFSPSSQQAPLLPSTSQPKTTTSTPSTSKNVSPTTGGGFGDLVGLFHQHHGAQPQTISPTQTTHTSLPITSWGNEKNNADIGFGEFTAAPSNKIATNNGKGSAIEDDIMGAFCQQPAANSHWSGPPPLPQHHHQMDSFF